MVKRLKFFKRSLLILAILPISLLDIKTDIKNFVLIVSIIVIYTAYGYIDRYIDELKEINNEKET